LIFDEEERMNKLSRVKKAFLGIGAIAAVVVTFITIYDRVLQPSTAKLTLKFFESSSDTLRLDPPIDTRTELTEEIPIRLKIDNTGGRASGNTKLYLAYNSSLEVSTAYKSEENRTWNSPNEPLRQLRLAVENINPGESFLIPLQIRLQIPRDTQRFLRMPRDQYGFKEPVPLDFVIYADLSAETVSSNRTTLRIVIGRCDVLQDEGDVYWVGHGKDGVEVLKVQADYPCRG
jgi:hypothetical protein